MPGAVTAPPTPLNVCASVVTYHPGPRFLDHFAELMRQVPRWLIIDNCSPEEDRRRLRKLAGSSVELIENPENLGVATALNQAARRAHSLGCEWLLTFDQDSQPAPGILMQLMEAYRSVSQSDKLGMIGSNFVLEATGKPFYTCEPANGITADQTCLITSGSLLSLRAFFQVGPFRDELFIDGVDSEFCLRLRREGFKVVASCAPAMRHDIGEIRVHQLLWKRPMVTHHSALRRYYMTRNGIVIAREYGRSEPQWVRLSLKTLAISLVGAMLFERQKLKKLAATILGVVDALRGRMGRIDARWLRG